MVGRRVGRDLNAVLTYKVLRNKDTKIEVLQAFINIKIFK